MEDFPTPKMDGATEARRAPDQHDAERTSMTETDSDAVLVLEDGTMLRGRSCGAHGEVSGEICFNTSLVGYEEVISDPSYAGQILVMTYPQIGNYGTNSADMQSDHLALRALVVRDMCRTPSNWRSEKPLHELLKEEGVVAIEDIDTRMLTQHIRDRGAMRAVISTIDLDASSLLAKVKASPSLVGVNLAATVSTRKPYSFTHGVDIRPRLAGSAQRAAESSRERRARYHVVAYDCGVKRGILRGLADVGCEVQVVPWDTSAEEVLAQHPDGVFLSNGPGDPGAVEETARAISQIMGKVPLFGICLGHQIIALSAGATVYKLGYGHHGGNQPVKNLLNDRVEITSQNHGFCVDVTTLGDYGADYVFDDPHDLRCWTDRHIAPICRNDRYGRAQLTHVNLNDGTAEGIAWLDVPCFSVQYHPEASPGPRDASYLFHAFCRLMDGRADYLDIDIRESRLGGITAKSVGGAISTTAREDVNDTEGGR